MPQDQKTELHAAIMNLPCDESNAHRLSDLGHAYKVGHRDARHAAAELARRSLIGSPAASVPTPRLALDVTLDDAAGTALIDMLGEDREDPTPIRLIVGSGHSGYGLYAASNDYPEEGCILLAASPAPATAVGAAKPALDAEAFFAANAKDAQAMAVGAAKPEPVATPEFMALVGALEAAVFATGGDPSHPEVVSARNAVRAAYAALPAPAQEATPLSDFIRNASPERKAEVFGKVMDAAVERQREVLKDSDSGGVVGGKENDRG